MSSRVLGLMSGTSADGIDAVLLELQGWPVLRENTQRVALALPTGLPRGRVVAHTFTPYPDGLRQKVLEAMHDKLNTAELTQLHWQLGEILAQAALTLSEGADLIASHGQTVQHHPKIDLARGWQVPATLQLGEAAVIAERTGKPVVADFRPADLAAGGLGAPLVPFADWALFAQNGVKRVLLNIGGIANITWLPSLNPAEVLAFDTGCGNCLLDEIAGLLGQTCDEDGRLAARGKVIDTLLTRWLTQPELKLAPPKATGREIWRLDHLLTQEEGSFAVEDLAATATALTAQTIAEALRFLPATPDEVVIAGGGAKNPVLMQVLARHLSPIPLKTFADLHWDKQGFTDTTREAAAFAFLGYAHAQGWPNTLPQATGAKRATRAGKWNPVPKETYDQ